MKILEDNGRSRIITRRTEVEVEFHQVDMMQVVHNSHYLRWFELGRMQILESILPLSWAVTNRVATPVVRNECDYLWPAVYGDKLIITTRHRKVTHYDGRFRFEHSIAHSGTKRELARGKTEVTVVDLHGHQLLRDIPVQIWDKYQTL